MSMRHPRARRYAEMGSADTGHLEGVDLVGPALRVELGEVVRVALAAPLAARVGPLDVRRSRRRLVPVVLLAAEQPVAAVGEDGEAGEVDRWLIRVGVEVAVPHVE